MIIRTTAVVVGSLEIPGRKIERERERETHTYTHTIDEKTTKFL